MVGTLQGEELIKYIGTVGPCHVIVVLKEHYKRPTIIKGMFKGYFRFRYCCFVP